MSYTPRENRNALADLARDISLHMELCECGEEMEYLPAYKAEPDTGTAEWGGGFVCHSCGKQRPDAVEKLDPATEWKYRRSSDEG